MYCYSCVSQQGTDNNFRGVCDTRKIHSDAHSEVNQEELIIKSYFMYGFDYQTICLFLEKFHGITVSLRTLKNCRRTMDSIKLDMIYRMLVCG